MGKGKKRPWSKISKPYAASATTAYQLGAKTRFSPNKCGFQAPFTAINAIKAIGRYFGVKFSVSGNDGSGYLDLTK